MRVEQNVSWSQCNCPHKINKKKLKKETHDLQKLGSHGLHLLPGGRAHVEGADDRAHVLSGLDRRQTGDARAHDEHLGGRDVTSHRELACKQNTPSFKLPIRELKETHRRRNAETHSRLPRRLGTQKCLPWKRGCRTPAPVISFAGRSLTRRWSRPFLEVTRPERRLASGRRC